MVEHDLGLVLVAALICATGVAATMMVLSRAVQSDRPAVWSALAGVCVSAAIWSTHFVAMLAYHPHLNISYDITLTAASFVAGLLMMTAGLGMAVRFRHDRLAVTAAGLLLGAGVVALHYLGMAAVQLAGTLRYDTDLVVASLVFSLGLGAVALRLGVRGNGVDRPRGALLLLLMTVSLHFMAMGAASIQMDPYQVAVTPGIERPTLAIIVAGATITMLLIGIASVIVDERISAQMAADAERFRTLADGTFEGIVIHQEGRILDCNRAFREIVGWTGDRLPPALSAYAEPATLASLTTAPRDPVEVTLQRSSGERFSAEVCGRAIRLNDGSGGQLLAVRDVSARKHVEAQLNHLALHDQLTDLPNRRLFIELASKAISQGRRTGRQFAIQILDLDGFKLVNDMHGHEAGDVLLSEISARLKECLRDEDVVARFGGDEFVILETGTRQPTDAIIVAERLLERIREPIALPGGAEVAIGGSIGIAIFPDDGGTVDDLLRNADTAMYRAKADGKGTYRFFESEMDTTLMNRRRLESRLRRAVQEQTLDVVYQPLVDSQTQAPLGFEALVRWHDAELGQVSPDQFIPVAEETGLIVALGEYVLHRACADAARWPSPLRVAVNLSAVQFRRHGLVRAVQSALETSGLPGNRLDLEITESILIENREQVLAILQQLKAMQIRISMDDFGTGYSSLSYLQSFPFDKIKIDRVFISDIQNSHRNSSIIQAVVAMGRSLSMKVVAEGVETAEQADLLGGMRCDELQGFLIARPMPAADIPDFIARQTRQARQAGQSAA